MSKRLRWLFVLLLIFACTICKADGITYSCQQSVSPFHPVDWGMEFAAVIEATDGKDIGNKEDVQSQITISGINEPLTAIYHCDQSGLASVSVTIRERVDMSIGFRDTEDGKAAYQLIVNFLKPLSNDEFISISSSQLTAYRSSISDAIVGYLEQENGRYNLVVELYKPIIFDQKMFRNSDSFYMTTEDNGDVLFMTATDSMVGFDTSYSKNSGYDRSANVLATKIRLQGSRVNTKLSIPTYSLLYAYSGVKKPTNISTMIFVVDGVMYQFNDPYTTPLSVTQYNEYSQQFTIWMNGSNTSFMEALEKSKSTVTVELRGSDFQLVFDLPAKAKANLVKDWKLYKKANGNNPVFEKMIGELKNKMTEY